MALTRLVLHQAEEKAETLSVWQHPVRAPPGIPGGEEHAADGGVTSLYCP